VGLERNATDRPTAQVGDQDRPAEVDVGADWVAELPPIALLENEVAGDPLLVEDTEGLGVRLALEESNDDAAAICLTRQGASIPFVRRMG
jgi:hypothetical protein